MIDPLAASVKIAGSGLAAQSARLRVISENMANAQSTGRTAGADPYRRKTISFANEVDRAAGVKLVRINTIGVDPTPFAVEHDPAIRPPTPMAT
jgi:flagellar basal-body rod protein FlgC